RPPNPAPRMRTSRLIRRGGRARRPQGVVSSRDPTPAVNGGAPAEWWPALVLGRSDAPAGEADQLGPLAERACGVRQPGDRLDGLVATPDDVVAAAGDGDAERDAAADLAGHVHREQ